MTTQRKTSKHHPSHPHDSLFKTIFKRPKYCRSLLQVLLTPKLYAFFNWPQLKIIESVATGTKGQERRADIVLAVPLSQEKFSLIITIILEHKSYRDNNTVRQMLGYYNDIAQQSGGTIFPIIVTCCQDKQATIPSDYLSWSLQQQGAPAELKQQLNKHLPNFRCLLVNLHDLSYRRLRRGGQAVALALFGMRNYWDMDEEVVAEILAQARLLEREEQGFVLSVLMDYYECADKGYGWKGFDKVERNRFPHLKEEERIMPTIEFGFDRAKQQGIEQGMQRGIEKERQDAATRMLTRGMPEEQILDLLQLTAEQLDNIKRRLKN